MALSIYMATAGQQKMDVGIVCVMMEQPTVQRHSATVLKDVLNLLTHVLVSVAQFACPRDDKTKVCLIIVDGCHFPI